MTNQDLKDVWTIGGFIVFWAFTAGMLWMKLNNRIDNNAKDAHQEALNVKEESTAARSVVKSDIEAKAIELRSQLNGLGGRLTAQEQNCAGISGRIEAIERQIVEARVQEADVLARLGKVEGKVEGVDDHMTEMKIELFGHLGEIKQMIMQKDGDLRQFISDKDTNMRERMARVEQVRAIGHKDI